MTMTPASDRLLRVLATGDIGGMAQLVKDWTADELNLLVQDTADYFEREIDRIDAVTLRLLGKNSAADRPVIMESAWREVLHAMEVCSEICGVAYHYGATPPKDED